MAYNDCKFDNDGQSVKVTVRYAVVPNQVAYVVPNGSTVGFLGIIAKNSVTVASGDEVNINIDQRAYQFYVPDALGAVVFGDTVYITVATVTGHTPDAAAYTLTSGAGKVALFKAIASRDTTLGSGNYYVKGILLPEGV